jgi:hypothetical protein
MILTIIFFVVSFADNVNDPLFSECTINVCSEQAAEMDSVGKVWPRYCYKCPEGQDQLIFLREYFLEGWKYLIGPHKSFQGRYFISIVPCLQTEVDSMGNVWTSWCFMGKKVEFEKIGGRIWAYKQDFAGGYPQLQYRRILVEQDALIGYLEIFDQVDRRSEEGGIGNSGVVSFIQTQRKAGYQLENGQGKYLDYDEMTQENIKKHQVKQKKKHEVEYLENDERQVSSDFNETGQNSSMSLENNGIEFLLVESESEELEKSTNLTENQLSSSEIFIENAKNSSEDSEVVPNNTEKIDPTSLFSSNISLFSNNTENIDLASFFSSNISLVSNNTEKIDPASLFSSNISLLPNQSEIENISAIETIEKSEKKKHHKNHNEKNLVDISKKFEIHQVESEPKTDVVTITNIIHLNTTDITSTLTINQNNENQEENDKSLLDSQNFEENSNEKSFESQKIEFPIKIFEKTCTRLEGDRSGRYFFERHLKNGQRVEYKRNEFENFIIDPSKFSRIPEISSESSEFLEIDEKSPCKVYLDDLIEVEFESDLYIPGMFWEIVYDEGVPVKYLRSYMASDQVNGMYIIDQDSGFRLRSFI